MSIKEPHKPLSLDFGVLENCGCYTEKTVKNCKTKGGFANNFGVGDFGSPRLVQNELADIPDKMLVEPLEIGGIHTEKIKFEFCEKSYF